MKKLVAVAVAALAIVGLSGCVVVPAYEPGYRPYYGYGPGYYDRDYRYYRRGYRSHSYY
jgi:hypothetical protein